MKKVLITGGATGIGKACADLYIKKGYEVYITYNNTLPQKSDAIAVKCDLRNTVEIENLFKTVKNIDILINAAGTSLIKMINDTTDTEYDNVMNTNLKATFFCCKEAVKQMIGKHSGTIINISSMWGEVGASCETCYSASKAGVIGLTKALAKEVAPSNITVNCVSPGIIDTRMNDCFDTSELIEEIPLERLGSADEVADAVYFLSESPYITGQILSVNGGTVI